MSFSTNLCIVPARGGSKRVRGKNIRNFAGKPMISHTLDTLRRSELFERIIVSTDSAEISEVAEKYGAEVPFERPARLSDDTATIADVMAHASHFLKDSGELGDVESVSCVFATNPFLQERDLKKGIAKLFDQNRDFVISVGLLPVSVARVLIVKPGEETCTMNSQEHALTMSQNLASSYYDAAHFYIGKPESWLNKKPIFDGRAGFVKIPELRVKDIDTEDDWKIAEKLFSLLEKEA